MKLTFLAIISGSNITYQVFFNSRPFYDLPEGWVGHVYNLSKKDHLTNFN